MTETQDLRTFWEDRYSAMTDPTNGKPSGVLERLAAGRVPARALDIGCARGDDALWLAAKGWTVTGVDVSQTALDIAADRARTAGLADRITFERHTLPETFPDGSFDLVSALFFQSPMAFDRASVLELAARATAPGGLLVIAAHNTAPRWRMADHDHRPAFPTPEEDRAATAKSGHVWREIEVGLSAREVTGPDGETDTVKDSHVILERVS
ncbi:MAG: class I SAM-dependent methyltransferase [Maritimibacter sp.]|uniref:class I SAM-dependent methyltransferase n=1 Tax=Maritimibacter sp. TaxID=2003363 RepID=UPI001D763B94|nr:class I SAM-dependent methyltransferase [Maritimibacter sp.]MBL6428725.1 class I SAM-dependent methyltransferase [Maritimibacter sp.]